MKRCTFILLLFGLCFNSLIVYAQQSFMLGDREGIQTEMLSSVIRDRNNYMWFGSYDGLYKHEGSRIKLYNRIGSDSASISSGEMHALYEDHKGFIWIGTTAGLDKIDPVTGIIKHYRPELDGKIVSGGYIYSIFQDKYHNIWASCDAGMFRFNYETGACENIPVGKDGSSIQSSVTGYKSSFDTEEGLWIQTSQGIAFYEYKTKQFHHRHHNPNKKPVFELPFRYLVGAASDLCPDGKGGFYFIPTLRLLVHYNPKTEALDTIRYETPKDAWRCCFALARDHRGNIWMGFRHGGILIFNPADRSFMPVRYENSNSLIGSNYIYSMAEDYQRRMWVTTDQHLYIIDLYAGSVRSQRLSDDPDFVKLKHNAGIMTMDSAQNLYIPFARRAIFRHDTKTHVTEEFRPEPGLRTSITYVHQKGKKLLTTFLESFMEARLKDGKIELLPYSSHFNTKLDKSQFAVLWMYERSPTDIYYKKTNGLLYHYDGTDSIKRWNCPGFMKSLCLSKDSQYLYFINKDDNLTRRDLNTGATKTYIVLDSTERHGVLFSNPRDLEDDGLGNIWITSQNGIFKLELKTNRIESYKTRDGLSHDFTYAVVADDYSDVWVLSFFGIDRYDRKTNAFTRAVAFTDATYMDAFGSAIKAGDGVLYFNAGNKLIWIDPDSFTIQQQTSSLLINEVKINGVNVDWNSTHVKDDLHYSENRILVRFGLLNFTDQNKINYFYRLENHQSSWIRNDIPGVHPKISSSTC